MTPPPGIKVLPGMTGRAYGETVKNNIKRSQLIILTNAVFSSTDTKSTYVRKYDAELKTVNKHKVGKGLLVDKAL